MSNLFLRIATAVVGIPLIVFLTYLGGWPFAIFVIVATLAAQYEFYGLARLGGVNPNTWIGLLLGAIVCLRFATEWAGPALLALGILLVALVPFRRDERPIESLGATVLGVLYPAAMTSTLIDLRLTPSPGIDSVDSFLLTMTVFVLVWSTDTFAYFVGRSIGRRPLASAVSPKKTWEGAIGGALGALVVAIVLRLTIIDFLDWPHVIAIAFICGVVSQVGDLAESWMKRAVGAKDSGNLLPGHGGVLDRIDALILAVPLVYLYLLAAGVLAS